MKWNKSINTYKEMFKSLSNIIEINFKNFGDKTNVKNMDNMFDTCKALTSINFNNINLSNFNTSKVEYMKSLFSGCNS